MRCRAASRGCDHGFRSIMILWVEKHRPVTLRDVAGNAEAVEALKAYVAKQKHNL